MSRWKQVTHLNVCAEYSLYKRPWDGKSLHFQPGPPPRWDGCLSETWKSVVVAGPRWPRSATGLTVTKRPKSSVFVEVAGWETLIRCLVYHMMDVRRVWGRISCVVLKRCENKVCETAVSLGIAVSCFITEFLFAELKRWQLGVFGMSDQCPGHVFSFMDIFLSPLISPLMQFFFAC